jgi:hypothetical protein
MRVQVGGARRRWGGTLVEGAVVGSLSLMLLLGTVVIGLGVFRYQQVADLAREGTRYASVNNATQPNAGAIKTYLLTYASGMDSSKLQCSVTWGTGVVTVTVTYQWIPEAFLASSAITLSGTSTALITN